MLENICDQEGRRKLVFINTTEEIWWQMQYAICRARFEADFHQLQVVIECTNMKQKVLFGKIVERSSGRILGEAFQEVRVLDVRISVGAELFRHLEGSTWGSRLQRAGGWRQLEGRVG